MWRWSVAAVTGRWFVVLALAAGGLGLLLLLLLRDTLAQAAPAVPWLLAVIMLGMGMTLRPADFAVVTRTPWALGVGVAAQYLVMPLTGLALARLLDLSPALAAGMVLVGASPGGTASNVMVFLAQGDTALSVAMTTFWHNVSGSLLAGWWSRRPVERAAPERDRVG